MPWYEKNGASLALRLAGVALLGLAWFAASLLRSRALAGPVEGDPVAFLLAGATFVCGSGGALLGLLGRHIFDRVEVSRRWRHPD
jgi:hypothetical protein